MEIKKLAFSGLTAFALLFGLLAAAIPALAQNTTFRVQIDRVTSSEFPKMEALVTVSDRYGLAFATLAKGDLKLSEDGHPVTDFDFNPTQVSDQPLALVIAVTTNASMGKTQYAFPLNDAAEAVKALNKAMSPSEQLGLITFGDSAAVLQELSSDRAVTEASLGKLAAGGRNALYDGVVQGIQMLKNRTGRRLLVVVNNLAAYSPAGAIYNYSEALAQAQSAGVAVMTIAVGPNAENANLKKLAESTGGRSLALADTSTLKNELAEVLRSLRSHYQLRYNSKLSADAKEHELIVGATINTVYNEDKARFVANSRAVKVTLPNLTTDQEVGGKQVVFAPEMVPVSPPITLVELMLDGSPLVVGSSAAKPFNIVWDSTKTLPGSHDFTVQATDSSGNTGTASVRLVVLPPLTVKLVNPAGGAELNGTVKLFAEVIALDKAEKVEFFLDEKQSLKVLPGDPNQTLYEITWDTSTASAGAHTLSVTATDKNGLTASSIKVPVGVVLQKDLGILFLAVLVLLAAGILVLTLAARSRRKKGKAGPPQVQDAAEAVTELGALPRPARGTPPTGPAALVEIDVELGTSWPLNKDEVRIGRKRDENDIPLSSPRASRRHAVIRRKNGQYTIYAVTPANPVILNGEPVQEGVLTANDRLLLGEQSFRFEQKG